MTSTPRTFVGATTFRVAGMTCAHCERAIREEIGRVAGVRGVEVDLSTGAVTVRVDAAVDRADIAAAVGEAGYALVP
ncbi:heavy-metal-associated domain-containing protein [Geodermatophilus sp. SYSU D00697]